MRRRYGAGVETFRARIFALARSAFEEEERRYSPRCLSGADTAEAPLYNGIYRFYERVALGEDPAAVVASEDERWRRYARENAKKIAEAPKFKRGPMEGHSVIHYRYVSPDAFRHRLPYLLAMVAKSRSES